MLSLSLQQPRHGRVVDAITSAMPAVFGSALTLATFVLVVVVAHFNSWDQFFFTVFKAFQTSGSGISVSIRLVLA